MLCLLTIVQNNETGSPKNISISKRRRTVFTDEENEIRNARKHRVEQFLLHDSELTSFEVNIDMSKNANFQMELENLKANVAVMEVNTSQLATQQKESNAAMVTLRTQVNKYLENINKQKRAFEKEKAEFIAELAIVQKQSDEYKTSLEKVKMECEEQKSKMKQFYLSRLQHIMTGKQDTNNELLHENQFILKESEKNGQVSFDESDKLNLQNQRETEISPSLLTQNDCRAKERTCVACGKRARQVTSIPHCSSMCKQNYL